MSTIKATPAFMRDAKKLLSQEALNDLTDSLVLAPKQGVIIQGTGGVRKMRWQTGKDGKGKQARTEKANEAVYVCCTILMAYSLFCC